MLPRVASCGLACLLLAGGPSRADGSPVTLQDTDVVVDAQLVRESEATVYVAVSASTGLRDSRPVDKATVKISLEKPDGESVGLVAEDKTGPTGRAFVRFRVPRVTPGPYRLVISTSSEYGSETIRKQIRVSDKTVVHLRTDRGVYKPGQNIRWRVTALSGADAHPFAGDVEIVVKDPRGTAIWRDRTRTDETGMVAGELPLGDDLLLGDYRLYATAGAAAATETVQVRQFELPPFKVSIEASSSLPLQAGETFKGAVVARYSYGEPVSGKLHLSVRANNEYIVNETRELDADGRYELSFAVDGPTEISAQVTDGAGRGGSARFDVPLRSDELRVAIVPERAELTANTPQWVTVVTTDGNGNFAPAQVFLKVPGRAKRIAKKSKGAVRFKLTPKTRYLQLTATATDEVGRVAKDHKYLSVTGSPERLVRVRDIIVDAGESVRVTGTWKSPAGPVVATLLRNGNPVASSLVEIDERGRLSAILDVPEGVFGLATVRVTDLGWDQSTGAVSLTTEQATVYLRGARLDIALDGVGRYRPGQTVIVGVAVTNALGMPAAGVALAASVVDERILALSEPRPDLVEVLRSLDLDHAEAAGILFTDLLRVKENPAVRLAMRAIVQSLPPEQWRPRVKITAAERFREQLELMRRAQSEVYKILLVDADPLGRRRDGKWEFRVGLSERLREAGWKDAERITPWKRPTTWNYARSLLPHWTFDAVAGSIANQRLDLLQARLEKTRRSSRRRLHRDQTVGLRYLVDKGKVADHLAIDPWGTELRVERVGDPTLDEAPTNHYLNLVSAGPDRRFGTKDDLQWIDVFHESQTIGTTGSGYGGGGGSAFGSIGTGRYGTIGHGSGVGSGPLGPLEVAVRKRFDETVLWVAGVRTDASGHASLRVPLADSITGWQVAVEALGQGGAVGAVTARLETFLPLYVDARVPARLTVADEYVVSAVAANHSKRRRVLTVALTASGSLELDGEGRKKVTLDPGTTKSVGFRVRAARAGQGKVTLSLSDNRGKPVDAMERSIQVDPPGNLVRRLQTGQLVEGAVELSIELPKDMAAKSFGGRIRLYRGAADQALDGLEGMIKEPHGCFEQTSSSTYPNLLVLRLLKDAPGMEQVRQRARDFVGKGYQRLITYEVAGGGFSWFGESPANQVLTAYGLMEFVDMAKVYPVDDQLIARTQKWLLRKQRKDGSWKPDKDWLHDWSAVQGKVSTTVYIAWALAESGYRGKALDRAFSFLRKHEGSVSKDPYLLGLWAAAREARGRDSARVMRLLAKHQTRTDGQLHYTAGGKTLFYASGNGADVQVTALAATALLRAGSSDKATEALAWLWSARSPSYGWGTTQGTVLALRAAALASGDEPPPREGKLAVHMDGKHIGTIDLASPGIPTVELPAATRAGSHKLTIKGAVEGSLSVDSRWSWRNKSDPKPESEGLSVALTAAAVETRIGQDVQLVLTVENKTSESVPMPMIVVPMPPGFTANAQGLRHLVNRGRIAKFQDQGSEIQIYLTELAAEAKVVLPYSLTATAVCSVTQRPAYAYAYYDPEVRGSSAGLRLKATD